MIQIITTFGWSFYSKKENYVGKTKLKNYFYLKDNKNYVGGFCIKIHFTCLSKC
jgi:hypothetical protein